MLLVILPFSLLMMFSYLHVIVGQIILQNLFPLPVSEMQNDYKAFPTKSNSEHQDEKKEGDYIGKFNVISI